MFGRRHIHSPEFLESLAQTWLFEECSSKELRAVAALLTPLSVQAGRELVRQGAPGREAFVVLDGQAVVERDHRIVGHAVAGSVVGEVALMRPGGRRNATVTAATEMDLLVLSRSDFTSLRGMEIDSINQRLHAALAAHEAFVEVEPEGASVGSALPQHARSA